MNKDLEIIKQNEPYRRIDFEDYKVGFDSIKWRAVIEAAERMAEEIERLKKIIHLCDYCQKEYPTCDAPKDIDFGRGKGNDNVVRCAAFVNGRNLWAEIARLKAELEKRPEVVRCGECEILEDDIESDETGGFCHYICKHCSTEDFCSRGQRRESEEGK